MHQKTLLASLLATMLGGVTHAAPPDYPDYTQCASLGGTCTMTGTRDVLLWGENVNSKTLTGSFACTGQTFGIGIIDPQPATATCWYGPEITSTPTPPTSGENFPTQTPPRDQVGYANVALSSTITGNILGGSTITVNTFEQLKAAAANIVIGAPATILVSGTLRGTGVINIARAKVIRGLPGAVLDGFGLAVNGVTTAYNDTAPCDSVTFDYYGHTRNVVIQNLTFRNTPDIAIRVTCGGHHVWIDHNTIVKPGGAGISITRGADYVTASWNRITDAAKALQVGHENSARQATQSKGHLHLSYHHNWHENTAQTQSLTYYGTVHAYNNYVQGAPASYFLGVANDASIYAEANSVVSVGSACKAFEGASRSHVTFTSSNIVLDQNAKDLPCKVVNDGTATPPPYSGYPLDAVGNVPVIVKQGAGAGRIVF
jgi:pectate lyase